MLVDPRSDLRLFIEQQSCPIMSANISTAVKLTASIEVLPTKEVRALKPMTNVVIGYRDASGSLPALNSADGVTYSVLFVGMLTSLHITKNGTSRSATLVCAGHKTLLERHYTFISNLPTQAFDHKKAFIGAASFLRTERGAGGLAQQVEATFSDDSPPFTPGLESLSGPPKGAIKLIEKCIGVTLPAGSVKEGDVHGAQHEFFAHASHQCRLLFQIGGVSVDEGLNKIVDKNTTGKLLGAGSSQLSEYVDLSTMLDILLRQLYYSFTTIGAPKTFISSDSAIRQRGNTLTELRGIFAGTEVSAGSLMPDSVGSESGSTMIAVKSATEIVYADIPASPLSIDAVAGDRLVELFLILKIKQATQM